MGMGSRHSKGKVMTSERFRAQSAFYRFKNALDSLEHEMKPLVPLMSLECNFEFETMAKIARSFFKMANQELFSKTKKSSCEVAQ